MSTDEFLKTLFQMQLPPASIMAAILFLDPRRFYQCCSCEEMAITSETFAIREPAVCKGSISSRIQMLKYRKPAEFVSWWPQFPVKKKIDFPRETPSWCRPAVSTFPYAQIVHFDGELVHVLV
jgi:hypothetical protein